MYSTALYSTWINVEELNLLIDAGDGLSAGLLAKSGKVKDVFVTHADRDHMMGLPQFLQLNTREGLPRIYYPKNSGSFPAMEGFLGKFDHHMRGAVWTGIEDRQIFRIKNDIEVQALRNEHIKTPIGIHKSLSYKVFRVKSKLKNEFSGLSGIELKQIGTQYGKNYLTEEIRENILSFSGDTPVDDYSRWDNTEVLIHEATFLPGENGEEIISKGNKHSRLDEVMKMVSEINVGSLILNHFSSRYSWKEIDAAVNKYIKFYKIKVPVYVVHPGEVKRNILKSNPLNF
ncbi:MBL fold metallo-hydrolase [Aureibacter tunicatorum]|nr:MBL fold metallo-hydrolase [Aureibacter tunicatorum]